MTKYLSEQNYFNSYFERAQPCNLHVWAELMVAGMCGTEVLVTGMCDTGASSCGFEAEGKGKERSLGQSRFLKLPLYCE